MNDHRNNTGSWLAMAGFAVLIAAVTAALAHRPTRKRIIHGLQDGIGETDKHLDELEEQTRTLARNAGKKMDATRKTAVHELRNRLTLLQEKLDELS